jgi:hypothetical protein
MMTRGSKSQNGPQSISESSIKAYQTINKFLCSMLEKVYPMHLQLESQGIPICYKGKDVF